MSWDDGQWLRRGIGRVIGVGVVCLAFAAFEYTATHGLGFFHKEPARQAEPTPKPVRAIEMAGPPAFTLADGRKITVKDGWHGTPEEQGFLHDIQGAACEMFTTVLAPGPNAYHYDHMHVDLMRGPSVCRPAAIPGEVAAARASGRNQPSLHSTL